MPQFTLRWLIIIISLFAVACVASAQASQLWLATMATLTLLMFLCGILEAMILRDGRRSFCIGFSVWGIAYLVLVGLVLERENGGLGTLLTTKALKKLHAAVVCEVPASGAQPLGLTVSGGGGGRLGVVLATPDYEPNYHWFMRVGQLVWSWLLAIAGGFTAKWLFSFAERQSDRDRT